MNPILRNILVCILAIVVGYILNMGISMLSLSLIDLPEGFNGMDPESFEKYKDQILQSSYLLALLAHAAGTLVAAFLVSKFVTTKARVFALGIGFLFLMAGITNLLSIPHPSWFAPVDLILCYIPMAILGWILGESRKD